MNLSTFRANEQLVEAAGKLFRTPLWKAMMEVMLEEHPMNYVETQLGLPESDNSKKLGIIQGYNIFNANLRAMGMPEKKALDVEATYGAEPKPKT